MGQTSGDATGHGIRGARPKSRRQSSGNTQSVALLHWLVMRRTVLVIMRVITLMFLGHNELKESKTVSLLCILFERQLGAYSALSMYSKRLLQDRPPVMALEVP